MVTPRQLRESANTLLRQRTHEIPAMIGFCERLRVELLEAADQLEGNRGSWIGEAFAGLPEHHQPK